MNIKTLVIGCVATALVVTSSFAGSSTKMTRRDWSKGRDTSKGKGGYQEQTPECFRAQELTIDVFGAYAVNSSGRSDGDAWGGGIGVNYFFTKMIGFGAEGYWLDAENHVLHSANGSLIIRFPIDSICLAPYVFGGGGGLFNSENNWQLHAGAGLEYRFSDNIGIFGDGRFVWLDRTSDYGLFRLGLRFAF